MHEGVYNEGDRWGNLDCFTGLRLNQDEVVTNRKSRFVAWFFLLKSFESAPHAWTALERYPGSFLLPFALVQ